MLILGGRWEAQPQGCDADTDVISIWQHMFGPVRSAAASYRRHQHMATYVWHFSGEGLAPAPRRAGHGRGAMAAGGAGGAAAAGAGQAAVMWCLVYF